MKNYEYLNIIYHEAPDMLEVVWNNNTRHAVDEYTQVLIEYAQYLRDNDKLQQPLYIILDVSKSGMYPVNYGTTKLSEIIDQLKDLPKAYGAYVTDSTNDRYMIERLEYFPSTRSQDTRRVFRTSERDDMIAWLLSNTKI